MTNTIGFILTVVYIFLVIGLGEGLRRWRGYSSDFTRKVVHIGVGMVMWLLPFLFTSPWPFIGACAAFMVINFLDWKFGFFAAMTSSDRSNLGTVYFPLASGLAALVFWEQPPLMVAAIMPLTWGDGLAPVFGRKFEWRPYSFWGYRRTLAGTITMIAASFAAVWLALWLVPGNPVLSPADAALPALVLAGICGLLEAITPWGLDNLTVTAGALLLLRLFF